MQAWGPAILSPIPDLPDVSGAGCDLEGRLEPLRSILGFSRETQHVGCACLSVSLSLCTYKEIYFKELAHMLMEAEKSTICRVGCQAASLEGPMVRFEFKGRLLQNSLLLWRGHPFVLFRPSADGVRPTHIMEDNLLYSKSTDLNVDLI